MSRFGCTTPSEASDIIQRLHSKDTTKANKTAAQTLKAYLNERKKNQDFENLPTNELNDILKEFYLDARKTDGKLYKTGSLKAIRHSLNRHLNGLPFNRRIDIIKDEAFREANVNFNSMLAHLKREGLGETNHYETISSSDIGKLYQSSFFSVDTPVGLFNKVQFDIRLYFFRRGAENMHKMSKSTFAVFKNPDTGVEYVINVKDELNKNHRHLDSEKSCGGMMPYIRGNPYCPVESFKKYISKLHPLCD